MQNYLLLMRYILSKGTTQSNRTGVNTSMVPGTILKYDLSEGFPVMTTRKAAPKSAMGEMIGFIKGCDNAAQFRALKCKFWDQNANENKDWLANPNRKGEDDLGRIYGVQYRDWNGELDQLKNAIDLILNNPTSRRILVTAWNPSEFHLMALPPCHYSFQFLCDTSRNVLHLTFNMRSNDVYLGLPNNIIGYAFLLEVVAQATGYTVGTLTYMGSDVHIYEDHIPFVKEQLKRVPYGLPVLRNNKPFTGERTAEAIVRHLESLHPDDFELINYQHHPAIVGAKMAV